MTSTIQAEKAQNLIEDFELLTDWEDRYDYLIDMGKRLPPLPAEAHAEENLVRGCQSQVWVTAAARETPEGRVIDVFADSNSTITKGIVGILVHIYSGESPRDILDFDIDGLMTKLELDQQLSPGRRNGLSGMVTRIKSLAALTA